MRAYLSCLLAASLCGCATRSRIPEPTETMASVYQSTVALGASEAEYEGPRAGAPERSVSTATGVSDVQKAFPRLPNPLLTVYVFPHLSGDLPVPGYVTAVPLYEQPPFALPDELIIDGEPK